MADHLINILGELLYRGPVDRSKSHLPSPLELKRKILIKAKKIKSRASSSSLHMWHHFECPAGEVSFASKAVIEPATAPISPSRHSSVIAAGIEMKMP